MLRCYIGLSWQKKKLMPFFSLWQMLIFIPPGYFLFLFECSSTILKHYRLISSSLSRCSLNFVWGFHTFLDHPGPGVSYLTKLLQKMQWCTILEATRKHSNTSNTRGGQSCKLTCQEHGDSHVLCLSWAESALSGLKRKRQLGVHLAFHFNYRNWQQFHLWPVQTMGQLWLMPVSTR